MGTEFLSKKHEYKLVQVPGTPLTQGMQVQLYAILPTIYHSAHNLPLTGSYSAYDAHVVGRITRIAERRGKIVGIEVQNNCWRNMVKTIRLDVPYIPDITVQCLAHLKTRSGPKEARDDRLSHPIQVVLPLTIWSCGVGQCATHKLGTLNNGSLYVYWTMEPEVPGDESAGRQPRKRQGHGNLQATR